MQFDAHCMECLIRRHYQLALEKQDGTKAYLYLRDIMQAILDAPAGVSAPWLTEHFTEIYGKYWPGEDPYRQLKQKANDMVLSLLPQLRQTIAQTSDPLSMALGLSQAGNYLDFGILTAETAHRSLETALAHVQENTVNRTVYTQFLSDLSHAGSLLILGDNAGEIAFDVLLVEQLHRLYPSLEILYCVRGQRALNDATREDASYVGMDRIASILDNGSGISGTEIAYAGDALRSALHSADVILSKGSGNLESMAGCGLNVYYIFMCKCHRVAQLLDCGNMTGQFLRELDLPPMDPLVGALRR